jgi:hypothetical protein
MAIGVSPMICFAAERLFRLFCVLGEIGKGYPRQFTELPVPFDDLHGIITQRQVKMFLSKPALQFLSGGNGHGMGGEVDGALGHLEEFLIVPAPGDVTDGVERAVEQGEQFAGWCDGQVVADDVDGTGVLGHRPERAIHLAAGQLVRGEAALTHRRGHEAFQEVHLRKTLSEFLDGMLHVTSGEQVDATDEHQHGPG